MTRRIRPTDYLLSMGWRRDPTLDVECGAVSESATGTGFCAHVAQWEKPYYRGPMCAQHAVIAERYRGRRIGPLRSEVSGG